MHGLKAAGVEIDRKMLADLAVKDRRRIQRSLPTQAKAALARHRQGVRYALSLMANDPTAKTLAELGVAGRRSA